MKKLKLKALLTILKWFDVPVMYKMKIDFRERTISALPSEDGAARGDAIVNGNYFIGTIYRDSVAPGVQIAHLNFSEPTALGAHLGGRQA